MDNFLAYPYMCVTNGHGYITLIIITITSFSRSWRNYRVYDKSNTIGSTGGAGPLALSKILRPPPFYGWIRVAKSLVFCGMLFRPLFVVCPSSDSGFSLLLWYLPTLHVSTFCTFTINTTKRVRLIIFLLQKVRTKFQGTSIYKLTVNIYWYFSTLYITLTHNWSKKPCFMFNKQIIP